MLLFIFKDYSDPDSHQYHQQNVHFPANQTFPSVDHQENNVHSLRCGAENENVVSVSDELKKNGVKKILFAI